FLHLGPRRRNGHLRDGSVASAGRGMCRRTRASDAQTMAIASAHAVKKAGAPPRSSAKAPTYDATTLPMRPTATAVPTPVPRMAVGYTCAATAYIVVWTALRSPPVSANMAMSPADIGGARGIAVIARALATAIVDMPIRVIREPRR